MLSSPRSARETVLNKLHSNYPEVSQTKSVAWSYFWWPGLDKSIEDLVKGCIPCCCPLAPMGLTHKPLAELEYSCEFRWSFSWYEMSSSSTDTTCNLSSMSSHHFLSHTHMTLCVPSSSCVCWTVRKNTFKQPGGHHDTAFLPQFTSTRAAMNCTPSVSAQKYL